MNDTGNRLKQTGESVNTRMLALMDIMCEPGILKDAMVYSITAGGKRLRPALCLWSAGIFGDERRAMDMACAIEMIHTYSLIHDDLPAMDDDNLRRGKLTSHKVFGEALAILAGDGLLNVAFEVMLKCALREKDGALDVIGAMDIIAGATGVNGMISGQVADITYEGDEQTEDVLEYIHARKTAAMIRASVMAGAALFRASEEEIAVLETYGNCVGLVFQIIDDILDETGDPQKLGKTPGKDVSADKQTFVRIYGIGGSRQIAQRKTQQAIDALSCFGDRADRLRDLAGYLLARDK